MKKLEVQMDIFTLHRQGFSFRAIAHKLGIHRNTVKKYIQEIIRRLNDEGKITRNRFYLLLSKPLKITFIRIITGPHGYTT